MATRKISSFQQWNERFAWANGSELNFSLLRMEKANCFSASFSNRWTFTLWKRRSLKSINSLPRETNRITRQINSITSTNRTTWKTNWNLQIGRRKTTNSLFACFWRNSLIFVVFKTVKRLNKENDQLKMENIRQKFVLMLRWNLQFFLQEISLLS